jgi:iron complex outermembrane receptor protein
MDRADQPSNGAFVAQYLPLMRPDITGPRVCTQAWTQFANRDDSGFGLRVNHDAGWSQLTSISSYRKNKFRWRQELAGMNLPPAPLSVPDDEGQESWQASQEFRLTGSSESVHWVVGAFGFKEHIDRLANVPNVRIPPIVSTYRIWTQKADSTSVAAFGQGTWEFAPGLSLTLGGRYTKDDKEIDQLLLTSNVVTYDLKGLEKSWSRFTPRASVDWRITDDVMVYVTWSKGYKSGAFVSQNATAAAASTPLEPEDARNIEGGFKSQWFGNRLRVNATYFDLTVDDLQLFRLVAGNLVSENANAKVTGVEAEIAIVPVEGLTLDASVSTMDPRYDGGTFDRKYLARAQKLHWSLNGAYSQSLSGGATLRYGASYVHSGDYFHEATNLQTSYVPSSKFVDANLKYTAASGKWDLSLWGKNLTDEVIVRHLIVGALAGSNIVYQPPRTYGATVNLYFD